MRILMLAQFYPPIVGGEEHLVDALAIELAQRGHDAAVATIQHPGLAAREEVEGVHETDMLPEGEFVLDAGAISHDKGAVTLLQAFARIDAPSLPLVMLPEIVIHGETGLLVGGGDVEGLQRALTKLLGDESPRVRLGENGRRRAEQHFSADAVIPQFERLYATTLGQSET